MASFYYQVRNNKSELLRGKLEADSEQQAIEELTRRGFYIISLDWEQDSALHPDKTRIKLKDLAQFCGRLAELLSAGLPLLRALDLLQRQFEGKEFGKVLQELTVKIRDGASISRALADFDFIPPILPALLASGEASGNIDFALEQAATIFERELDLRSKIKSAMFYPALVFGVGILTVFFLLAFVIPRISEIFEDLGQALPFITRAVIAFSAFCANFWWLLVILAAVGYYIFRRYIRGGKGKIFWEEFKFRLPFMGRLWNQRELIFFCRTLGMLVKAGVPLVKAVDLTSSVVGSQKYRGRLGSLSRDLKEGFSLSRSIRGFLPQEVSDIVAVGEESGSLENALLKLAQNYEKELDYRLKLATQMLEPLMILLVGLVVGIIIVAVLLPIFQLNILIR